MRPTISWLLSAFIVVVSAVPDASVYLLEGRRNFSPNPPTLTPEQARLIIAQRLEVSQYHRLGDATAATVSYINEFGGHYLSPFVTSEETPIGELVVMVDGVSSEVEEILQEALGVKPALRIAGSFSKTANSQLVRDLSQQIGKADGCTAESFTKTPLDGACSTGFNIIYQDLSESSMLNELVAALRKYKESFVSSEHANALIILVPRTSGTSKLKAVYGSYDMPSQALLRSRQFQETTISDNAASVPKTPTKVPHSLGNSTIRPITGVPAVCYSTLDSCNENTNNCSGHGKCYKKRGVKDTDACFACACQAQNETFTHGTPPKKGVRLVYWGGAACQKKDVSAPFWLISLFTIVLIGLVGWAIGLMYSIGEEKLPGVIGAGVSNNRAR